MMTYFSHYYADSDIDIMCNKENIFDFIDEAYKMINIISKNIDDESCEKLLDNLEKNTNVTVLEIKNRRFKCPKV